MSQKRGTATDRLLSVIQVLQLGRKTGHLTVERDVGRGLERGEIIFVQGQITQAYGNIWRGQEALKWLASWEACRFTFAPTPPEKITTPLQAQPFAPFENSVSSQDSAALPELRQNPSWTNATGPHASPSFALVIPHRACALNVALAMLKQVNVSYAHQQLFLLIDGNRNINELTRLSGRASAEVLSLLQELKYIGVIE